MLRLQQFNLENFKNKINFFFKNRFFLVSFFIHSIFFFSCFFISFNPYVIIFVNHKLDKINPANIKISFISRYSSKKSLFKSGSSKIINQKNKKNIPATTYKKSKKKNEHKKKKQLLKKKLQKTNVQQVVKKQEPIKNDIFKKNIIQQEAKLPIEKITNQVIQSNNSEEDILYVSQKEYDALSVHYEIQSSIAHIWNCPKGILNGKAAEIMICIDINGMVEKKEWIKKTNILMYDLSVEEVIEKITFPQQVRGKKIILSFAS